MNLTKREFMALGMGAAAAATFGGLTLPAHAASDAEALIQKFTGGKQAATGKVSLNTPEIAENGNTVPVTVDVESPMTKDNYVDSVLVLADGNPRAGVATFHFTPLSGVATATTRIRLAKTQNVIAIAKMSNGDFFMEKKEVKVTIGGCGG